MAIYIIPIFCFGVVITGIVLIGIQQASDLAKQLSGLTKETEPVANKSHEVSALRGIDTVKPLPIISIS